MFADDGGHVTHYVWDAFNLIAEYDGSNQLTASYVTMPTGGSASDAKAPAEVLEETRGSATSYFLHDGSESTVATTDALGVVTARYNYDAFGSPAFGNGSETGYSWTGAQYDSATGLYYLRDRYYDPQTGRFVSQDPPSAKYYDAPLGRWSHQDPKLDVSVPVSYNLYAYAGDDPVNAVDPSGDDFRGLSLGLACVFAFSAFISPQLPEDAREPAEAPAHCIYESEEDIKRRQEAQEVADASAEGDSEEVAELALDNIGETLVEIEEISIEITIAED